MDETIVKSVTISENPPAGEKQENESQKAPGQKKENESQKVNGPSAALFTGYNAETTFKHSFPLKATGERQATAKVLVADHLKWYMYAERITRNGEGYLAAYVRPEGQDRYPMKFDVKFELEANETKHRITSFLTCAYDEPNYRYSGCILIRWKRLLKERERFETDGQLTVSAVLTVRMPTCCNFKAGRSFSDVTLKVGDVSFPFNKAVLAAHSSFFDACFFGPMRSTSQIQGLEVKLTDVNITAFVNLINCLFVRSFTFNIKHVGAVLHLADRFGMLAVVEHCEQLLISCALYTEPYLAERLVLSGKYSLKNLQKRCLELCSSIKIAKEVRASPHYKDIADDVKLALLDHVVEVTPANCRQCEKTTRAAPPPAIVHIGYTAEATFKLTFSLDAVEEKKQSTEKVLIGNHLKWYMYAMRITRDGEGYLAVYIDSDDLEKYPFSLEVKFTLEATSAKDSIIDSLTHEPNNRYIGVRLVTWKKLLNERAKFEVVSMITVTAALTARLPTCCNFDAANAFTDVKLKVKTEIFAFNKMALAAHSPFFAALFFGPLKEPANQNEMVTLSDVNVTAFVNLINKLFVCSFNFKTKRVVPVLHLADRFGMQAVVDHCEQMLMSLGPSGEPCLAERLALAGKYSLKNLQKRCLELCDSAKIAKEVRASSYYKDVADDVKLKLLERVMDILL